MKLQGKKIVVVGAGSGMGRAIAQMAADEGMDVISVGRTLEKLVVGRKLAVDVTRDADVAALFAEVGPFDHLVTTIADLAYAPIADFSRDAMMRALDSKLLATLSMVKYAKVQGSIVLTGGIAAERPMPGASVVAAVNASLDGLARALAVELAPIRVNVLSPGWVDTPAWDRVPVDKSAAFAAMAQRLPVRRIGTPEDIAHAAKFLLENGFTNGVVLPVDGGHRFV